MADKLPAIRPPREAGAANVIDLRPSAVARVAAAFRGAYNGWFGPGPSLPPQAPEDVAGRQLDYPVATNLNYQPKYAEGANFGTLRTLAYSWDLLRLVIETRKDEICKLEWNIGYKDEKKKSDARTQMVQDFFAMPDKEHTWEEWLRMLLEDLLVIDAPCLYPRPTLSNGLYALEPVDGSTIKRIIDDWGRTPQLPHVAYQQILKGLPATDYNRDTLIYRPRNLRTNRIYGYSPVEQILITINIALNRQASQLQYYTEGSTPDLILSVPEGWSPEQIAKFKTWWDSILQGNVGAKRGTMFVFNGTKGIDTKDKLLVDQADEWLARVVCFAFGQSPQPFIKENNRATAETAAKSSKEQGTLATMSWVSNLMNLLLAKYFNAPDMKFRWAEEDETDPKIKAEINERKLKTGTISRNEWREQDGQDPIENGDEFLIYTASGAQTIDQVLNPPDPPPVVPGAFGAPAKKPALDPKTKKPLEKAALPAQLRPITTEEQALVKAIAKVLRKVRTDVAASMLKMNYVEKAHNVTPLVESETVLANVDLSALAQLKVVIESALIESGVSGFVKALEEAGVDTGADVFGLANPRAVSYASERAAEFIKEITDGTRTLIRGTIVEALEEGWSYTELADELSKAYAFSSERAATIASTEMNDAVTNSALSAWKDSGVVKGVRWLLSNDEGVCPICNGNADQGTIPLGKEFESGDEGPPAHPNCRCSISPVVD